jgi:hypothetical protein|tara:strand:- start:4927 stop:5370 length:444 start_codon:yes stop_codon:yes gene_type:complete
MKEVVFVTTSKKHKKVVGFVLLITALTLFYPSLVVTSEKPQRVYEVCGCRFPAEVGAFKNLEVISARYTLLHYLPSNAAMVLEIFAEKNGETYRIVSLVASTETNSVGKVGPIVEILKWNGDYWPAQIIYQLNNDQVYLAAAQLHEE